MWRKANRLAGAQLKHCKERGEWAELYFMMMAAGFGMRVSKPFGDLGKYDVGVESHIRQHHARENKVYENEGRVLRVQVKSTIYKRRGGHYSLNMMGFHRKRYLPGTVDFFAVLLIPVDDWYIVPYEVMGSKNCTLHFTPSSTRQKYGAYREAWHLLEGDPGLTIHACSDEEVPEDFPQSG